MSNFSALPPPSLVVPVIGINSNVVVNGVEFHVQTEDLGPRHGHLVTHVFRDGGCVVKSIKLDYSQHTDKSNLHAVLPRVMKAHHAKLIRSLQQGRLDSIPPCVTMRRSEPGDIPHLAQIAREAGIGDPPGGHDSEPPSTVRSGPEISDEDPRLDNAPSTANLWDRLVEEAHRGHLIGSPQNPRSEPKATFSAWDRAVESSRQAIQGTAHSHDDTPLSGVATNSVAAAAFADGLAHMRASDNHSAVVSLAKAVQLNPDNREYRAALRRALDWLDEHA